MATTPIRILTADDARATFFTDEAEHGPIDATLKIGVHERMGAVSRADLSVVRPPGELIAIATRPIEVVVSRPNHGSITTEAIPIEPDDTVGGAGEPAATFAISLDTPDALFDPEEVSESEGGDEADSDEDSLPVNMLARVYVAQEFDIPHDEIHEWSDERVRYYLRRAEGRDDTDGAKPDEVDVDELVRELDGDDTDRDDLTDAILMGSAGRTSASVPIHRPRDEMDRRRQEIREMRDAADSILENVLEKLAEQAREDTDYDDTHEVSDDTGDRKYRDYDSVRSIPFLTTSRADALREAGYMSVGDLRRADWDELRNVDGIGNAAASRICAVLDPEGEYA